MANTSWRYHIVYETTNLANGRKYIGCHKTNEINDGYVGSGTLLKRAVKKHGKESFIRKDLFVFSSEAEMFAKERELITQSIIDDEGYYNVNAGGNGGFTHIHNNMDKYRGMFSRKPEGWQHWSKTDPERHSKVMSENSKKAAITMRNRLGEDVYLEKLRQAALSQKGGNKMGAKSAKGNKWITDGNRKKKAPAFYVLEEGWSYGLPCSLKPVTVAKVTKECSFCGNEMVLYPSQAKTRQCCSRSCARKNVTKMGLHNG